MSVKFNYCLDGVKFELAEKIDTGIIQHLGTLYSVYDKNDSGNISFVIKQEYEKFLIKVAGLCTINGIVNKKNAVKNLRDAYDKYSKIHHPKLIKPNKFWEQDGLAFMSFPYVQGECLFDHWNFELYKKKHINSPLERFLLLDIEKRMKLVDTLFEFYNNVNETGYVATDFYEGSIIYNFGNDSFYFCDIDFFTKYPFTNESGFQWGPDRFLAPEEKKKGFIIDTSTDVYHLGVFISIILGNELRAFQKNRIVQKATSSLKNDRYLSIKEFYSDWKKLL